VQPEATTPEPVPSPEAPPFASRALSAMQREIAMVLLLVEVVVCALLSPQFLTGRNLLNIADDASIYALIAAGQMLVILSAGIDLSVGSFIAVGAFFAAVMSHNGIILAIVVPLAVTGLLGFVNGLGAAYTRVPPFIITLAMLSVARGIFQQAAAIYQGVSTAGAGASAVSANNTGLFPAISQGTPLGSHFPLQFDTVIALFIFVILAYVLRYTRFGRHVFAIGGNEAAAALLGVRVRRVKLAIYTISGVLAGLGGVLLASRLTSAPSIAGQGYELDAITAVVVGGTLLTGGVGTVRGTFVGLLIIRILPDIFNLKGLDVAWQQVATGAVLLAVVLLQLLVVPGSSIGGLRLRRGSGPGRQGAQAA
jgi:ribose/xylose/arabinose/galactoside ABC-type transport system permease subunit